MLKMEIHLLCLHRKLCHIYLAATGMTRYKVWYQLLIKAFFSIHPVKNILELMEKAEFRLPHKIQDLRRSMFRRYFKAA